MTKIFVLLYVVMQGHGIATHSVEFTSLEACERAKQVVMAGKGFTTYHVPAVSCLPKGE